jgi:hypothetical protein
VGRRARRRGERAPAAPKAGYARGGHRLRLRTVMTVATRAEYAEIAGNREDAWQRRVEFLFERLVDAWEVEGLELDRRQLLGRFRMASADERRLLREVLREHLAEHFPDLEAP